MSKKFCIDYVEIEHWHRTIPERFYLNDVDEVEEREVYRKLNGVIVMPCRHSTKEYDRFTIKYNTEKECDIYKRVKQLFYIIFNECLRIDYDEISDLITTISHAIRETSKDERSLMLLTGLWYEIEEREKDMSVDLEDIIEEWEGW